jgi:hypothetical protein
MSNGQEIQEIRGWAAAEFAITLAVERTRDLEVVGPSYWFEIIFIFHADYISRR